MRFVPIIVTNAPLFSARYRHDDIDDQGNLNKFVSVRAVSSIGYNFSEVLHWDSALKQKIAGEDGSHGKTIFCTQLKDLVSFIKKFSQTT